MRQFPSFAEIKALSFDEQREQLLSPDFRASILADEPKVSRYADTNKMISSWDKMFVLPHDLSYEPGHGDSLAGLPKPRAAT